MGVGPAGVLDQGCAGACRCVQRLEPAWAWRYRAQTLNLPGPPCPPLPRPAGNQSSGVLLGMQVPPEDDAEFTAAGGPTNNALFFGFLVPRCARALRSSPPMQRPRRPPMRGTESNSFCCSFAPALAPAVSSLGADFTFTEMGGKARQVFQMFCS